MLTIRVYKHNIKSNKFLITTKTKNFCIQKSCKLIEMFCTIPLKILHYSVVRTDKTSKNSDCVKLDFNVRTSST